VEIDCGGWPCGGPPQKPLLRSPKAIRRGPSASSSRHPKALSRGGDCQHMDSYEDPRSPNRDRRCYGLRRPWQRPLKAEGLECDIVGGGGTGSLLFSRAHRACLTSFSVLLRLHGRRFDGRILDKGTASAFGPRVKGETRCFILTLDHLSHAKRGRTKAILRFAGLQSPNPLDSRPLAVHLRGARDVEYVGNCFRPEHGALIAGDQMGPLKVNDKLKGWSPRPLRTQPWQTCTIFGYVGGPGRGGAGPKVRDPVFWARSTRAPRGLRLLYLNPKGRRGKNRKRAQRRKQQNEKTHTHMFPFS